MSNWFNIIEEKLMRWWVYLIKMLPNFALAVIVLIAFIFAARLIQRLSHKFFLRVAKSESISGLISGVLYTLVVIFGIMISLQIMQLDKAVSSLLAGVGIIGLALGFAFQDLTANFISGAFIAFKQPFDIGHTVETNGFIGTIEEIRLRSTTLRTSAGLHVIIPNKEIFQKPIINYSLSKERRVELEFQIPNTIDLNFMEEQLKAALKDAGSNETVRNVEVVYSAIADPKIQVYISFWTSNNEPNEFRKARHQAILAIYKVFADNKIYTIQFSNKENGQVKQPAQ
ncbi:mechanosensitive ion channel family protein [Ohtaekwangia koreensis]|uniref:Mechanosensitive ion channel n=1 Tax=Ohtaekwangia koreensis TaxID=688867 RepID=A0A1T5K2A5_9BACT|nr:mechanosensitive ion channel family protein [Ohtaekwangia koreensis]SKC57912.1 Mechanosensitive ion channel [Ohtaekwangia koreensis]